MEQPELMQVKLILHIENISNEPKSKPKSLTKLQRNILKELEVNDYMTREQLAQKMELSLGTIKRKITDLRTTGYLDREEGNAYGKWATLYPQVFLINRYSSMDYYGFQFTHLGENFSL